MALRALELTHFRNLAAARIELSEQLTLLVGRNGQGKTNILEAVYLLLQGRDFRTATEREAVQRGTDLASLNGIGDVMGRPQRWHHRIPKSGRRTHQGPVVPLVLFSPDDVYLAKGSPERRRRFLDLLLSAHDPRYAKSLRIYHRVLLQRNRALKEGAFQGVVDDFTPLLIQEGLYLWKRRGETLDALLPEARQIHQRIASGEDLAFQLQYGGSADAIATADAYADAVERRRHDERIRQTTLVGPHRDDMAMSINDLETTVYASQGQLRTLALSLKLATYSWLVQETGIRPIILLDDVLSELDERRRRAILEAVSAPGQQTVVTDTEPRSYAALDPVILRVQNGEVDPWIPPNSPA